VFTQLRGLFTISKIMIYSLGYVEHLSRVWVPQRMLGKPPLTTVCEQ